MTLRFETYISSPADIADRRFVVVVYQEGRGRFKVRRSVQLDTKVASYVVSTLGSHDFVPREEIFSSVAMSLEQLFAEGALTVSYVEGDILVEFPAEFSTHFEDKKLQELAVMAVRGVAPLVSDFAEPLYSNSEVCASSNSITALQLCVLIVLAISLIMYFYGSSVLPLEWMGVCAYCFAGVLIVGVIFRNFTLSLIETGKVLALCFFGASAILLMLLIGVVSKEFSRDSIISKEGIIESMFEGSKSDVMRVRFASKPNVTYLISKIYLKEQPSRLPQAIRAKILDGFFNTHYVTEIEIIR